MQARQIKTTLSLLAIAAAGAFLFFHYFEPAPRIEPLPHLAIGEALAEQAIKALGASGRITLIAPDIAAFEYPAYELQLKTFHQALERANFKVAATNWIKINPMVLRRVPPGDFADIIRRQADNDVIVSLLGPPFLTPEQKARVGEKRPRIIANCSGDMPVHFDLRPLFADDLLYAAIISRRVPGPATQADNLSQTFKRLFQWVTAQNLGELPEPITR